MFCLKNNPLPPCTTVGRRILCDVYPIQRYSAGEHVCGEWCVWWTVYCMSRDSSYTPSISFHRFIAILLKEMDNAAEALKEDDISLLQCINCMANMRTSIHLSWRIVFFLVESPSETEYLVLYLVLCYKSCCIMILYKTFFVRMLCSIDEDWYVRMTSSERHIACIRNTSVGHFSLLWRRLTKANIWCGIWSMQ